MRTRAAVAAFAWVALLPAGASGQEPSPWNVHYAIDGALVGAFTGGSVLLSMVEVDTTRRWDSELLPWDQSVRGVHSDTASARSDALGALTVAGPVFVALGDGMDESDAHRGVIYAEALSAALLLNATAKYLVQRPRPYVYGQDPALVRKSGTKDAHLSFYSGHAAITFTAAVAGSTMFAVQSRDEAARATLWGVELAMASATANLRVRAGKHFYSDVLLGAIVGAGIGATVPRLHLYEPNRYRPTAAEWASMGGGVAAGTLAAWLMPAPQDIRQRLGATSVDVVPVWLADGGVLTLCGRF